MWDLINSYTVWPFLTCILLLLPEFSQLNHLLGIRKKNAYLCLQFQQFTPPTIYQPRKLWSVIGFYYCMDFFYKQNWNTYKKRFDWMFSGHRQWNRFVKHMWPTYVEEPHIATTAWGQERARFSNLSPFVIGLSVQIWGPCWLGNRPIRIPVEPRQWLEDIDQFFLVGWAPFLRGNSREGPVTMSTTLAHSILFYFHL